MNAYLLALVLRIFYQLQPEYEGLEPWELEHVLYSLGYIQDLPDEADMELAYAAVVLDWPAEAA